jgi:DNA helicase II / ATP-dependent DNA helicase PcrA
MSKARNNGHIDFEDVRLCVRERLADAAFAKRVGAALAARFCEIVVDEAQDCNRSDLAIVNWLRGSEIPIKIICDPNQSIYGFRGGVGDELETFATTFDAKDHLSMTGNFRSTPAICAAIAALRPHGMRSHVDQAVGRYRNDATPVHILSYPGNGVPSTIGLTFRELLVDLNIPVHDAPVLAATRGSAAKAIGQPIMNKSNHATLQLADAIMNYHFAFAVGNRRAALDSLHRIILQVRGGISTLVEYDTNRPVGDARWRSEVISIANALRFRPGDTARQWLGRAREVLAAGMVGPLSINQRLRDHPQLSTALAKAPTDSPPARTIHSAKGLEFPGVCVVMTTQVAGDIFDLLEGQSSTEADEEARKIYVGASRAERLLAIAVPKSRAARLTNLLRGSGCLTQLHEI